MLIINTMHSPMYHFNNGLDLSHVWMSNGRHMARKAINPFSIAKFDKCQIMWVLLNWFFMFLQLLPIRSPQRNFRLHYKSMLKHRQKSDLPRFSYGYRKCMFVDFLIEYMDPPHSSVE